MNIGLAQYFRNPDWMTCEFGLVVADEWQQKGLGYKLLTSLIEIARHKGLKSMIGHVLNSNTSMLELARFLGFEITQGEDANIKTVTKKL